MNLAHRNTQETRGLLLPLPPGYKLPNRVSRLPSSARRIKLGFAQHHLLTPEAEALMRA